MDDMLIVLWISCVVWSILCVILFFKIWGMCNNVRSILQILVMREADKNESLLLHPQKEEKKVDVPKITNKTLEESQDAMMAFNNECLNLFKRCKSKEEFESGVDKIIAEYNKDDFDFSILKDGLWEQFNLL